MRALVDGLLGLGRQFATSERQARHVRIANATALIGAVLAIASIPFDVEVGPWWFIPLDLFGLAAFASCWVLNAKGHLTASRVTMVVAVNVLFAYSAAIVGQQARMDVVFFALVILPFLVFELDRVWLLAATVALPILIYTGIEVATAATGRAQYSVVGYRIYTSALAFVGLVAGSLVSARINRDAELALEDARARAVGSSRMAALGEMASGIAHEIRNPLATLTLAADQLALCKSLDDVRPLQARIERVVGRVSKIIDALSSFARDASGDPFVHVELHHVLDETLEMCRRRFAVHDIALEVADVPPSLVVECRPVQISQVLLNLMNNAHDAVEDAAVRWVRLDAGVDGDVLELAVSDSGPGIPPAVRPHLFEPFFTTKRPGRGTGLGLSLSRGLVEAHHGTIELDEHAPNTRFVVRIPLRQPHA